MEVVTRWVNDVTWENLPLVHDGGLMVVPILGLLFYFGIVLYLLPLMWKDRPATDVKGFLPIWNLFLFSGSFSGAVVYLVITVYRHFGSSVYEMICDPQQKAYDGLFGLLAWTFLISKFVEFGDTIIIVIKKRPVAFIHWYHHATVMFYTWISLSNRNSLGQWFGLVNAWVHAFMYYYYWQTSIGKKIWWGKILTGMQIQQMGVGVVLLVCWVYFWMNGLKCSSTDPYLTVVAGLVMYGSYFVLFLRFYHERYGSEGRNNNKNNKDE